MASSALWSHVAWGVETQEMALLVEFDYGDV
jgi:hypothetical protein